MRNNQSKTSILIVCPFPLDTSAGQRLKYEQYITHWKSIGYEVTISNYVDNSFWKVIYKKGNFKDKVLGIIRGHFRRLRDVLRLSRYDIVYIFMWVTPFGSTLMEWLFINLANNIIFDLEDNLFHREKLSKSYLRNPLLYIFKNLNKQKLLIRESDYIITSSPDLAKICKRLNKYRRAVYITSSVNTDKFKPIPKLIKEKVVVGWTGTFSSKIYLESIESILLKLSNRVDYKLHIIGDFEYSLTGVDLEVSQWSLENEVKLMRSFDIGIYPLPMNNWVKGKSGLKAIQYMAFGIPTVASNIGNTPNIITNRIEGILVRSEDEWILALEELINNPQLRDKMGKNAREKALRKYSLQSVSESYANVLNNFKVKHK